MFGFGKKLDTAEIKNEMQTGKAILVDVREDDEWEAGHAEDAVHLSLNRIMSGEVPSKNTATKLYLYCRSGGRAGVAANMLRSKGYEVENIGGLSSWRSAGGAVEY